MKRKLALFLIAAGMVLALAGCGSKNEEAAPAPAVVEESAENEEIVEDEEVSEDEEVVEEIGEDEPDEEVFATLEDYYSVEENFNVLLDSIQSTLEDNAEVYSDIAFNVLGNTLTYSYYYIDYPDDPDALEENICASLDQLSDDDWANIRYDIARDSGITDDITVVFAYYDPDEELLASYEATIPEM